MRDLFLVLDNLLSESIRVLCFGVVSVLALESNERDRR